MDIGFHIKCKNCHSNNTSIKHTEKFNDFRHVRYDSYTEHLVHLICEECDNKKLMYSYNTY